MNIIKKIKQYFKTEEPIDPTHEREFRSLLRENLKTVVVDVFYYDDPLNSLTGPDRKTYLQYFHLLLKDERFMTRLKFFINKQANITLKNSKDGILDAAGIMKMDGMGTMKDDIERLSGMYLKEEKEQEPIAPDLLRGI